MATKSQFPEHTDVTMTAEVSQKEASVVTGLFQYKKRICYDHDTEHLNN
jgi:hypothetical protein